MSSVRRWRLESFSWRRNVQVVVMLRHHSSELTPCLSHYEWRITPLSCQDSSWYWSPLTKYLRTRTGPRISRAWLRGTNICLRLWETLQIGADNLQDPSPWQYFSLGPSSSDNLEHFSFTFTAFTFSCRPWVAQDSGVGCGAVLAWRIINQYWEERLRRAMFCRNFSTAAASWVAEREAPLSLPVIHHQTTRNLNIPTNRPDLGPVPNADDGEGIRIIRD